MSYEWVKAFHIISLIAWMAAMLYLPRLFVYHTQHETGSATSETFKIMERRLLRAIMTPAMIATFVFGIWLIGLLGESLWTSGWFHAKLLLVLIMTIVHGLMARWQRAFAEDRNAHSQKFFRIWNEVPTVLLIAIVILAVVKPF